MRRSARVALSLAVIIFITACTGSVDEELLPTLVPTLDPEALIQEAIAARSTEVPTATNTPEPASGTEDTNAEPDSAAEDATSDGGSSVIEYGGVAVSASDTVTDTENLALTEISALEDVTETAEIDAAQPITSTETLSVTEPLEDTREAATDVLSATETLTATGQAVSTGVMTETDVAEAESAVAGEPVDAATEEAEQTLPAEATGTTSDEATEEPTVEPSVPQATEEPAASVDPTLAGMPDSILDNMAVADPDNGEPLTLSNACTGCHSLDPNQIMAGPTWYNLAETAANRVEGQSAGLYLYNSILHPNDYVVEGFQPNIMLQIYQDTLSEQDLADIISYLLTLRGR